MSHQPASFYRPTARSTLRVTKSTPLNSRARQRHALQPLDLNERAGRGYQPGMLLQDQDPVSESEVDDYDLENVGLKMLDLLLGIVQFHQGVMLGPGTMIQLLPTP